ncbi:MAG: PKD domain-containing protein [Flavobacteriales bacterium]
MCTHIVGGDIHYICNGGNSYTIVMKIYRDCYNGISGFDDPASIGAFDQDGDLVMNIEIPLSQGVITILPTELDNMCFNPPTDVCVEECRYEETVTLNIPAGGLTLAYQRCCRNTSIVNCASNDDIGMTITAFIPDPSLAVCNSNPAFISFPPVFICMNVPFEMDHSAVDLDGDDLVYSFCNPLLENMVGNYINPPGAPPYPLLNFYPEFSAAYPIASDPAFTLDPVTGLLSGTPNELGQYVVGICVEEYRNGVLLSSTNRDFQFNVTLCEPNVAASIPEPENFCAGAELSFENSSVNAATFHWDFGVPELDNDTSNVESPSYTFPYAGEFPVTLIVNPGTMCADTTQVIFGTYPPLNPVIQLGEFACMNNTETYDFAVNDDASLNADYAWNFGLGSTPVNSASVSVSNVVLNPNNVLNTVTLTITDNNCTETTQIVVENPPDPVAAITEQDAFCNGFTYMFQNESVNASSYLWNFGDTGGDDFSTDENPEYEFNGPGQFQIMLVANAANSCPDTTYLTFEIFGTLEPFFDDNPAQCFEGNSFDFVAEGASTAQAQYQWAFETGASALTSTQSNPQNISFDAPGRYDVLLTMSENGCTESYLDSVWVILNFENEFSVASPEGCAPIVANFTAESIAEVPVYYLWNFGDGSTSTAQNPSHVYENPGTYSVSVTANTLWGCVETETKNFPNVITVLAPPAAGFLIEPQLLDILNPNVIVTDVSVGSISCHYIMSDGGESDDCDFDYAWTESGTQTITQIVVNEFGCASSITGEVIITGFILYAPNTFTPNHDGLNDFWLPESTGVSAYHIQIFNRWGDVIFDSMDWTKPWTGDVHDGEFFAQDGVYTYHIKAQDLQLLPHEFTGHIVLIR